MELRCRLNKSTANVDNDMRLINRLDAALSELLGCRSVSNIRHACATLSKIFFTSHQYAGSLHHHL